MQLDLNLLAALDALLEEGSVAGAAARLHVTAPAMSRSLGRIRRTTGDQILVRTGRTMTPTPYAIAVREQVHELLQQVQGVLAPSRELDLATLERTFALRWHDSLVALGGPALLAAVRGQAPGVRLRFVAESSIDTPELRRGEIDLEANANRPSAPDIRAEKVGETRLVIVVRQGTRSLVSGPSPRSGTPPLSTSPSRDVETSAMPSMTPSRGSASSAAWWRPRPQKLPRWSSRAAPIS